MLKGKELLEGHLKNASREISSALRLIYSLSISNKEKRKLERKLIPAIREIERLKVSNIELEQPLSRKDKKEVKNGNRRRKESK